MTDDLEARLRAAIHAEADAADRTATRAEGAGDGDERARADTGPTAITPPFTRREDDSLVAIRSKIRTVRRRRRVLAVAAATAVVVVGLAALPRLGNDPTDLDTIGRPDGDQATTAPDQPDGSTTAPPATATTDTPTTAADGQATGTTAADPLDPSDPDVLGDGFQPLWPFPTRAAATEWRDAYRSGGQQPWHLDAEETARSFTTGFLGFTEVDQITSSDIGATDAQVGVGYTNADGSTSTAALIHLMRYGTGDDAPWEVVGTHDTDLRLETPDYGTTARSPMTVAGYVTGVDESVRVQVRQPSSATPLGETPTGQPAGGTDAPWETTVTFSGATDPAVTVVASTGGHVQDVERFAITGLRSLRG